MGLSIFYTGMLRRGQLPKLIDEVTDICDDLYWPYQMIRPTKDFPIEGLIFSMPGSEQIWLTFREDGRMSNPEDMITAALAQQAGGIADPKAMLHSVVQYAGPDAHMRMVRMMHYVTSKYFTSFHMIDESEYWESGNEEKCRDWFIMFNMWINNMSAELTKVSGLVNEAGQIYHLPGRELIRNGEPVKEMIKGLGHGV